MPSTPSGPDSASMVVQASYLCSGLSGPFLHCLHPVPSLASFLCSLHFPFCAPYLTPFTSVLYLPPAVQLDPHGVTEAEVKGMGVSRNCAHFLKTFFLPGARWSSSLQSFYGLTSQPACQTKPSPLLPEAALRKEDKSRFLSMFPLSLLFYFEI